MSDDADDTRGRVRDRYARAARAAEAGSCCDEVGCCDAGGTEVFGAVL